MVLGQQGSEILKHALDEGLLHASQSVQEVILGKQNLVASFIESTQMTSETLANGEWLSSPNHELFFVVGSGENPSVTTFLKDRWMKISPNLPFFELPPPIFNKRRSSTIWPQFSAPRWCYPIIWF